MLTRLQVDSQAKALAEAQRQQLLLQSDIAQLQQQIRDLQNELTASQADGAATSSALSEALAGAEALAAEVALVNQRVADAEAKNAGECVCVCCARLTSCDVIARAST